jgi:excisionase family DNA binding protein
VDHPQAPLPVRYLNYKRAAEYLDIPTGSLRSMVHNKTIPHVRIGPRTVTFDIADLDRWLASRKVTPSSSRSPKPA